MTGVSPVLYGAALFGGDEVTGLGEVVQLVPDGIGALAKLLGQPPQVGGGRAVGEELQ